MWQQNPFRADNRFLKEYSASDQQQPVDSFFRRIDSASSTLISLVASSRSGSVTSDLDWQRIAGLVQSPASANSEGSSTSTPDQCPASPTRTFCEMPASSRNGSCNNSMSEGMQKQNVWEDLPSQPSTVASLMDLECGKWPATSQAPQRASETGHLFSDEEQPAGWNPIENRAKMSSGGYRVDESLVSNALMSRNCSQPSVPGSLHFQIRNNLQHTASSEEQTLSSAYRLDMRDPPMIKQEEEYFLGGRNGLIIDGKVLSLHRTSTSNSKIGNFMDLLRQSNTPISDATTAASCSHLSQLLSSQEAPEMWVSQSSRLPAMLSEVLPSSSGGKSGIESFEARNKRKLLECSTSDVDIQDRRSTVQHHEGLKQQQDEAEPSNGVPTNDSEFSKKPKIENSNFPFKMQVRKEKLGERISALQQLVSPFGKTDTASVLLEAIGYIKFLHEQVQVLSSPYMKHTAIRHNEQGDEIKQDLRSRGLCLVPVSCTLQVANDNGADYWTPTLHAGLK